MIPPVVASDRGRAQTPRVATPSGGSRAAKWQFSAERDALESAAAAGDSPMRERARRLAAP